MHTGTDVNWNSVVLTSLRAHFGVPVVECLLALVGRMVRIGAGRAEVVVGDDFQDVWRAEFADSTFTVERIMIRLEILDRTHGARTTGSRRIVRNRLASMRRFVRNMLMSGFRFGAGIGGPYCFDTHRDGAEVEIVEVRVGSIVPFNFIHKIGQELKRGGSSDVIGVLFAECHKLIVK